MDRFEESSGFVVGWKRKDSESSKIYLIGIRLYFG